MKYHRSQQTLDLLEMALSGKTAIITGGASGIGLATAHNYLKDGVVVSLNRIQFCSN